MIRRLLLFGLPVVAAFGLGFGPALADGGSVPVPVALSSDGGEVESLDQLVAASDAVVLAEVVVTGDGRTITAPDDPTAGIRTQLAELRVVDVVAGEAPTALVLEEASSLLDGSAVSVDGGAPVSTGERGMFFLVAGGSEASPHWALVGPQGRYLVEGDHLVSTGTDALSVRLADAGGPALVDAVETAAGRRP